MSGTDHLSPRFIAARKAPTAPMEIMIYEHGEARVWPMEPLQALALAESLIELANKRLHEMARVVDGRLRDPDLGP